MNQLLSKSVLSLLAGLFVATLVEAQGTIVPVVPNYKLVAGKLNTILWEAKDVAQGDSAVEFSLCLREGTNCVPLKTNTKVTSISGKAVLEIPPETQPSLYVVKIAGAGIGEAKVDVEVVPSERPGFNLNMPPKQWQLGKSVPFTWSSNIDSHPMMSVTICIGKGADMTMDKCLFRANKAFREGLIDAPIDQKWAAGDDYYFMYSVQQRKPGAPILQGPFQVTATVKPLGDTSPVPAAESQSSLASNSPGNALPADQNNRSTSGQPPNNTAKATSPPVDKDPSQKKDALKQLKTNDGAIFPLSLHLVVFGLLLSMW